VKEFELDRRIKDDNLRKLSEETYLRKEKKTEHWDTEFLKI